MTKKLFEVTEGEVEKCVVIQVDSAPRAGSLFAITTPGKEDSAASLETAIKEIIEQNKKTKNSDISGSFAGLTPPMLRQTGKTGMVSELVEAKMEKLVVDSMTAVEDQARTVDAIPSDQKLKGFLTSTKSKVRIILEDTKFAPSPVVAMSGKNFKQAYKEQLNRIIYQGHMEGNVDALMSLTSVFDMVNHTKGGIQLSSSKYSRKLQDIINVLNNFFRTQHFILNSIVTMVKDEVSPDQPQPVKERPLSDYQPSPALDKPSADNNQQAEDIFEY